MQQLSTLSSQRGASMSTIILGLAMVGVIIKLGIATVPSYIGDYQFTKMISEELEKANGAKSSEKVFLESVGTQMSINANYNMKVEEVLTVTSKTPGNLAIRTNYSTESVLLGNTVVVNRFSADITKDGIKKNKPTVEEKREKLDLGTK